MCDVCGCVMSPTSNIYWVDLDFINNYKEPQLWLVLLRHNADVTSTFPWIIIIWYQSRVGNPMWAWRHYPHKVGHNEDIKDLSKGDCDTLIWLIVWCVWVCDKSHIWYLLGRVRLRRKKIKIKNSYIHVFRYASLTMIYGNNL